MGLGALRDGMGWCDGCYDYDRDWDGCALQIVGV